MCKNSLVFMVVLGLAFPVSLYSEDNKDEVIEKVKDSRSIVETILAMLGVSVASGGLKGDDDISKGELWIVDILDSDTKKVAKGNNYKSPIFHGEKNEIFALSKNKLVQFKKSYGLEKPIKFFSVPNIVKLLDSNLSDNELLVIDKNNTLGVLSLDSQKIRFFLYDKKLDKNKELINYLNGWSREYNNTTLLVTNSSKKTPYGDREWSDISIKKGQNKVENISKCDELNCNQPSFSKDKKYIVFIKESEED